jgi:hypothetical protein
MVSLVRKRDTYSLSARFCAFFVLADSVFVIVLQALSSIREESDLFKQSCFLKPCTACRIPMRQAEECGHDRFRPVKPWPPLQVNVEQAMQREDLFFNVR